MPISMIYSKPPKMNEPALILEKLFIDHSCQDYPLTQKIRSRLPKTSTEILTDLDDFLEDYRRKPDALGQGKRCLLLTKQKGEFVKPCPCTPNYLGCNYYVINLDLNCPLDCSYCILQLYLSNPLLTVHVNTEDLWTQLEAFLLSQKGRPLRIGTGELGDSLALDPITGRSPELISFFRKYPSAQLELKTKSTHIRNLLDTDPAENIVIAWSLNAADIARTDERGAPPVLARLEAAQAVVQKGYRVAFHFDPLIRHPDWKEGYADCISALLRKIPASRIAWISLGALRFPPALQGIIRARHPDSRILYEEFIRGLDGKVRYFKPLRLEMFRFAADRIKKSGGGIIPVYLCMESGEVWRKSIKKEPEGKEEIERFLSSPSGCCTT